MRLTVLVIVHEIRIESVESVDHSFGLANRDRESECLLRARVTKFLNDVVIASIWREGLRPPQTPVTRPERWSLRSHG
jgi:hypothetical protein